MASLDEIGYDKEMLVDPAPTGPQVRLPRDKADQLAASTVLGGTDEMDVAAIDRISSELQQFSESFEMDTHIDTMNQKRRDALLAGAASNVSEFGAAAVAQDLEQELGKEVDPREDYLERMRDAYATDESRLAYLEQNDLDDTFYRQQIRQELGKHAEGIGLNFSTVFDGLGLLLPFVEQSTVDGLAKHLEADGYSKGNTLRNYVATGESIGSIRDWFNAQDTKTKRDIVVSMSEWLQDNSGLVDANDLRSLAVLSSITSQDLGDYEGGVDYDKHAYSVASVLDIMALGGAVRGAGSIIKGTRTSLLSRTANSNPEVAARLEASAIAEDSGRVAGALGETREDLIIKNYLPQADEAYIPNDSALYKQVMLKRERALRTEAQVGVHLSAAEKAASRAAVQKSLVKNKELRRAFVTSKLDEDLNGLRVQAFYSTAEDDIPRMIVDMEKRFSGAKVEAVTVRADGSAFTRAPLAVPEKRMKTSTVKPTITKKAGFSAKHTASRLPKLEKGMFRSFRVEKADGTVSDTVHSLKGMQVERGDIIHYTDAPVETGKAVGKSPFDAPLAYAEFTPKRHVRVTFEKKFEGGEIDLDRIESMGALGRYFADSTTALSKETSAALLRGFDRTRALNEDLIGIMEPFYKAPEKVQKAVINILNRGSEEEKAFTVTQVKNIMTESGKYSAKELQQGAEAYWSARTTMDTIYQIRNAKVRDRMINEGYRHYESADITIAGRSVDESDAMSAGSFYNPRTGEVSDVTPEMAARLYDDGFYFVYSDDLQGTGRVQSNYILVDRQFKVDELPAQVLNYVEGYIPRMYRSQYFVARRHVAGAKINGKQQVADWETVATSATRTDGQRFVDRMRAEEPDYEYQFRYDRNLTQTEIAQSEYELDKFEGRLYYSKRGDALQDVTGIGNEISDPIYAINRAMASAASEVEMRPIMDLMKRRWIQTFPELSQGTFPAAMKDITNMSAEAVNQDRLRRAKTMWAMINRTESQGQYMEFWQRSSQAVGEWIEDKGFAKAGRVVRDVMGASEPLSLSRRAMFVASIALSPVRQLFIQSQQFLFLAGLDPKAGMKIAGGASALLLARSGKAEKAGRIALAARAGVTESEAADIIRGFDRSGLYESVDTHTSGRATLSRLEEGTLKSSGPIGRVGAGLQETGRNFVGLFQGIGFDVGERYNLASTYLVSYRRWKKANPGKRFVGEEAEAAVAADARALALSMTGAAKIGYQQGIASAATQFLSVQQKALMMMLPALSNLPLVGKFAAKHGTDVITPNEAKRLAAAQLLLFGSTGIGINSFVENFINENELSVAPENRQLLIGGLYDYLFNSLFDSDVSAASSVAAGGGPIESFSDFLDSVMTESLPTIAIGPSSTFYSRVGSAAKMGYYMSLDGEFTEDDAKVLFSNATRISSLANNAYVGTAMLMKGSEVNNQLQELGIPSTESEAFMKALLGLNTYAKNGTYKIWKDQKAKREDIEATAKESAKIIASRMASYSTSTTNYELTQLEQIVREETIFFKTFASEGDKEIFSAALKKELRDQNVIDQMIGMVMEHRYAGDPRALITTAYNSGIMTEKEYYDTLETIDYLYGKQE